MKFKCERCLYESNHPLGLFFEGNICSGCRVHDSKYIIDWEKRKIDLEKKVKSYVGINKNYDCIIPITGSADSFFVVDYVVQKLKLRPLLVSYNSHWTNKIGWHNISLIKYIFNLDCIVKTISPTSVKNIIRLTSSKLGSIYWHVHAGKTIFPVQVSVDFGIPLIIWGEFEATEQVGMYSYQSDVEMNRRYRREHILMGYEAEDLLKMNEIPEKDLNPFIYPSNKKIFENGTIGIYLSNYLKWDNFAQNSEMFRKYKFKVNKHLRTYDQFQNIDDSIYMTIHDLLKFSRYGYSKVKDHLTRDIRHKRITKLDALQILEKFSMTKIPLSYISNFCKWMNIDIQSFLYLISDNSQNIKSELSSNKFIYKSVINEFINNDNPDPPFKEFYTFGDFFDY